MTPDDPPRLETQILFVKRVRDSAREFYGEGGEETSSAWVQYREQGGAVKAAAGAVLDTTRATMVLRWIDKPVGLTARDWQVRRVVEGDTFEILSVKDSWERARFCELTVERRAGAGA